MVMVICNIHGNSFVTLVTPAVEESFLGGERFDPDKVCAVRHTVLADDDHVCECWTERVTVDKFQIPIDRAIALDDANFIEFFRLLQPVCYKCFDDWLKGQR
jgi:hypothetical protein